MKDTKLLMALRGLQPAPIWIASTVLKNKGRKDIREFLAKVVDEGDSVRVVLALFDLHLIRVLYTKKIKVSLLTDLPLFSDLFRNRLFTGLCQIPLLTVSARVLKKVK